ncbi:hypothetical protein MNBD_GAMMA04-302 [hydrothermal vent metagenome]|uniref:Uncharacterized protein n=1 Tax=hydrothermal vent metagenome TaxID=652676 RepID=A0A3B0WRC2_9ZZZZ
MVLSEEGHLDFRGDYESYLTTLN